MTDSLRFPDGFLFGAAISAYQTEGGNVNTDWWWWEHIESTPCAEPSGDACDFYHRYADDVAMLARSGLSSFRFGIEWARIEPAEGEFSRAELAHYRRLLDACREHGVAPIVTFHHFTVPRWLHEQGGIASEKFPALFERSPTHARSTSRKASVPVGGCSGSTRPGTPTTAKARSGRSTTCSRRTGAAPPRSAAARAFRPA